MLVAMGVQAPGAGETHYEPELFDRVPADAVAAISFGGTQDTLDRIQGQVDVDRLSESFEDLTGVSFDGVLDAFSGEGVLYVRPGGPVPDVTLALAPPDPDKTWTTIDRLARRLATQAGVQVQESIENGVAVNMLVAGDVTIRYARVDAETIVVTNDADGLAMLAEDGPKLVDSEGFQQAAEDVGLEDRTKGFVYVDVDGLLPMIEDLSGEAIPADAREGVAAIDSLILQTSGDGDTAKVSGFVRVPVALRGAGRPPGAGAGLLRTPGVEPEGGGVPHAVMSMKRFTTSEVMARAPQKAQPGDPRSRRRR